MASWGGALSGAATGAAAGSVVPGWGTAIGAGVGLLGSLLSNDRSNQQRADYSAAALAQAENEARYAQMLQALAMQRANAGTSDSFGTTTEYDPATNTWRASLGKLPDAVARSTYGANIQRGSVDVPRASYGNDVAAQRESEASRHVSGAGNALATYQPVSEAGLRGSLQEATSRANAETYRPLIADTLRTYARTGSAAGPVLAQLGRANADSLGRQMAENDVKARTTTAGINATNRSSLAETLKTFIGGAQQGPRNYPSQPSVDPATSMTQTLSARPAASAQPATMGVYGSPARTNAFTNASGMAAGGVASSNFPAAKVMGVGEGAGALIDALTKRGENGSAMDWFNAYTSGGYKPPTTPNIVGNNGMLVGPI